MNYLFLLSLLGHTQFTYMHIRLDFSDKLSEKNAFAFPITIPTQKFNIEIQCKSVS